MGLGTDINRYFPLAGAHKAWGNTQAKPTYVDYTRGSKQGDIYVNPNKGIDKFEPQDYNIYPTSAKHVWNSDNVEYNGHFENPSNFVRSYGQPNNRRRPQPGNISK